MLRRNRCYLKLTNELLPNLDGNIEDTDEDTNSAVAQSNTQADVNAPHSEAMRHEQGGTSSHQPQDMGGQSYHMQDTETCLTFSECIPMYMHTFSDYNQYRRSGKFCR